MNPDTLKGFNFFPNKSSHLRQSCIQSGEWTRTQRLGARMRLVSGLHISDLQRSVPQKHCPNSFEYQLMLHYATHGLLNNQHPELSGLVLSLVDERGQPREGFLRAHEVYNLKLNADLVVLS